MSRRGQTRTITDAGVRGWRDNYRRLRRHTPRAPPAWVLVCSRRTSLCRLAVSGRSLLSRLRQQTRPCLISGSDVVSEAGRVRDGCYRLCTACIARDSCMPPDIYLFYEPLVTSRAIPARKSLLPLAFPSVESNRLRVAWRACGRACLMKRASRRNWDTREHVPLVNGECGRNCRRARVLVLFSSIWKRFVCTRAQAGMRRSTLHANQRACCVLVDGDSSPTQNLLVPCESTSVGEKMLGIYSICSARLS